MVASSNYPNLSRPPLREALIDIRLSEPCVPSFVEKLSAQEFGGFLRVRDVKLGGFRFEVLEDKPAQAMVTSEEVLGGRFENADKTQVVLARRDGMTFSILKNYKNWEHTRNTAHRFWRLFLDLSGPVQVGRVALRYINVIEVPQGADFDHYLTAVPRIPKELPQLMGNFFQRIEVPFAEHSAVAIVTQAIETPTTVVLDIDVVSQDKMDGASPAIWDKFDALRLIKNSVFFSSLTPRTVESYR